MRRSLKLHPRSKCRAVSNIEISVSQDTTGHLNVRYFLIGDTRGIKIPPAAPPLRADELWKSTCFELFARRGPEKQYFEFNFSPSTQWAAYGFEDYRTSMHPLPDTAFPSISTSGSDAHMEVNASIALDAICGPASDAIMKLGVSAVIEEVDGAVSYWALSHPPGDPDFHHSDCFALSL